MKHDFFGVHMFLVYASYNEAIAKQNLDIDKSIQMQQSECQHTTRALVTSMLCNSAWDSVSADLDDIGFISLLVV